MSSGQQTPDLASLGVTSSRVDIGRCCILAFTVVLALFALSLRLLLFWVPNLQDGDEFNHAFGAAEILRGIWPSQGMFEHKPVGVFYPHIPFELMFGPTVFSIRALGLTLVVLTALFLALTVRVVDGKQAKRGALLIGVLYLALSLTCEGTATKSELTVNLLIACVFLFTCRATMEGRSAAFWLILAGASAGAASQVNYLSIPVSGSLFAGFFVSRVWGPATLRYPLRSIVGDITRVICVSIGTILLVQSPLVIKGLLLPFMHQQATFLGVYQKHHPFGEYVRHFRNMVKPLWPLLLVALVAGIASLRLRAPTPLAAMNRTALAALLGALVAASASGRFYPHYLLLSIPPLLLLGYGAIRTVLAHLFHGERRGVATHCAVFFTLALVSSKTVPVISLAPPAVEALIGDLTHRPVEDIPAIASYVKQNYDTEHSVFAYVDFRFAMAIYYLSGASNNGLLTSPLYYTDQNITAAFKSTPEGVVGDILQRQPKVVLVGEGNAAPITQDGASMTSLDLLLGNDLRAHYVFDREFKISNEEGGGSIKAFLLKS